MLLRRDTPQGGERDTKDCRQIAASGTIESYEVYPSLFVSDRNNAIYDLFCELLSSHGVSV